MKFLSSLLFIIPTSHYQPWDLVGSGVYRAFDSNHVIQTKSREWFILDAVEQEIKHYGSDGSFIKTVARKGSGPAELNQTNIIAFSEEKIFTVSPYKIKSFTLNGQVIKEIRRPENYLWLEKIQNGWIGYPTPYLVREYDEIVIYDNDLENRQVLCRWKTGVNTKNKLNRKGNRVILPYRPDSFALAHDGKLLFLRKPETNHIEVWDLSQKSLIRKFPLGLKIDVNENVRILYLQNTKRTSKIKHFSWYCDMEIGPEGNLYFYPISGIDKPLVFDKNGQAKEPKFKRQELGRILGVSDEYYWVSYRDPVEEDFCVRRILKNKLGTFINSYPIEEI